MSCCRCSGDIGSSLRLCADSTIIVEIFGCRTTNIGEWLSPSLPTYLSLAAACGKPDFVRASLRIGLG